MFDYNYDRSYYNVLFFLNHTFLNLYLNTVICEQIFLSNTKFFQRSIWPIEATLSGTTTLGQSGPGSYGNKKVNIHSSDLQN